MSEISEKVVGEIKYPNEDRPFEEKARIPKEFEMIKGGYFRSAENFCNQFAGFLLRDNDKARLAMFNLKETQSSLKAMQAFFKKIIVGHGFFQKDYSELELLEEQGIQNLMMVCSYFLEHQPSKYFSKYQINSWYNKRNEEKMKNACQALYGLLSEHVVVFPEKIYFEGALSFYPIIVEFFNTSDSGELMSFLYQ
jgi:hypothetical protein